MEEDGNAYQLLISKRKIDEDRSVDELTFTMNGEKIKAVGTEMWRIYKLKGTKALRKSNM